MSITTTLVPTITRSVNFVFDTEAGTNPIQERVLSIETFYLVESGDIPQMRRTTKHNSFITGTITIHVRTVQARVRSILRVVIQLAEFTLLGTPFTGTIVRGLFLSKRKVVQHNAKTCFQFYFSIRLYLKEPDTKNRETKLVRRGLFRRSPMTNCPEP